MKVLTGHLTATNKKHIKAILEANLMTAKVNSINYLLSLENDIYTVFTIQKDNSVIIGEKISKSKSTFKIN
jgi:putative heme iron utilization protein